VRFPVTLEADTTQKETEVTNKSTRKLEELKNKK